jgi:hypothetical protein
LAWRSVRFQPDYPPIKKWKPVLLNPKAAGGVKKESHRGSGATPGD